MHLSEFDYYLPDSLIAQEPPRQRGDSRLLVVRLDSDKLEHRRFSDLIDYLNPCDILVINDTKSYRPACWEKERHRSPGRSAASEKAFRRQ